MCYNAFCEREMHMAEVKFVLKAKKYTEESQVFLSVCQRICYVTLMLLPNIRVVQEMKLF